MSLCLSTILLLVAQAADSSPRTWEVDGVKREGLVYAPSKKTEGKVPLVFDFHGHGGTARNAARTHHIHEAWPEAVTDPEGKRPGWQKAPGDQNDRDLKFFDAVLAAMKKEFPVDENRIYATGHSNGGGFTYLLWATRGDTFAAFAPVAAGAGVYFKDAKPKPVFHAASEQDPLVTFAMQTRTLDRVKKLNGCSEKGEDWAKGCTLYPSNNGSPVVIFLHGEGHKYPAETPGLIVKFFKEQVRK
jgi:polyhydroxybutyrate depolymerase